MKIINGQFEAAEAIDLISQMVKVKIEYHGNKIKEGYSEEDIKFREEKIKRLQNELAQLRNSINLNGKISVDAEIFIRELKK